MITLEIDIDVDYTIRKGLKGTRGPYGEPETPDDDDEIVIHSARLYDGTDMLESLESYREEIEQAIWDKEDI